jgi:hypothetical protein
MPEIRAFFRTKTSKKGKKTMRRRSLMSLLSLAFIAISACNGYTPGEKAQEDPAPTDPSTLATVDACCDMERFFRTESFYFCYPSDGDPHEGLSGSILQRSETTTPKRCDGYLISTTKNTRLRITDLKTFVDFDKRDRFEATFEGLRYGCISMGSVPTENICVPQ